MSIVIAILVVTITVAYVARPTYEALKGQNLSEISYQKYGLIGITALLWTIHGSNAQDTAVIFAGAIIFSCCGVLLFLKYRYGGSGVRSTAVRRRR